MKTKVLKFDKPKTEWVETYQELTILNETTGHEDLWHNHYPFKKWLTYKYFPEGKFVLNSFTKNFVSLTLALNNSLF